MQRDASVCVCVCECVMCGGLSWGLMCGVVCGAHGVYVVGCWRMAPNLAGRAPLAGCPPPPHTHRLGHSWGCTRLPGCMGRSPLESIDLSHAVSDLVEEMGVAALGARQCDQAIMGRGGFCGRAGRGRCSGRPRWSNLGRTAVGRASRWARPASAKVG